MDILSVKNPDLVRKVVKKDLLGRKVLRKQGNKAKGKRVLNPHTNIFGPWPADGSVPSLIICMLCWLRDHLAHDGLFRIRRFKNRIKDLLEYYTRLHCQDVPDGSLPDVCV